MGLYLKTIYWLLLGSIALIKKKKNSNTEKCFSSTKLCWSKKTSAGTSTQKTKRSSMAKAKNLYVSKAATK